MLNLRASIDNFIQVFPVKVEVYIVQSILWVNSSNATLSLTVTDSARSANLIVVFEISRSVS